MSSTAETVELTSTEADLKIQPFQKTGEEMTAQAEKGEITDDASAGKMTELASYCKDQIKLMEEDRTTLVKPLNDHVKMINNRYKESKAPFESAVAIARDKLKKFHDKKEQERKEEEERLRKEEEERLLAEAAELEQKADEALESGDAEKAEELEQESQQVLEQSTNIVKPKSAGVVRGGMASSSTRKVKKVVIKDIVAAVKAQPQLFELNKTLATNMLKSGIEIPGLALEEESELVIR